jgi:hypothetical protein
MVVWQKPGADARVLDGTKVAFKAYGESAASAAAPSDDPPGADGNQPPPTDSGNDSRQPDSQSLAVSFPQPSAGLILTGPATIRVDQGKGGIYTACDAGGKGIPAMAGNFAWGVTPGDLMSNVRAGNPAVFVANKPGTATITVIHKGQEASMRVTITQSSLFSSAGGEETDDLGGRTESNAQNLFSSAGGEQTPPDSSLFSSAGGQQTSPSPKPEKPMGQPIQELVTDCRGYASLINYALEHGDAQQAYDYANIATAEGCKIDMAAVEGAVERRKQQAWQRQQDEKAQRIAQAQAAQQQEYERRRQQRRENNQKTQEAFQGMVNLFTQAMAGNKPSGGGSMPSASSSSGGSGSSGSYNFPTRTYAGQEAAPYKNTSSGGTRTGSVAASSSSVNSRCGKKISKSRLAGLDRSFSSMVDSWKKKRKRICGMTGMYGPGGVCHYMGTYLERDRYEANVRIWKQRVNIVNGCVGALPKKHTSSSSRQFQNCLKRYRAVKFLRCP